MYDILGWVLVLVMLMLEASERLKYEHRNHALRYTVMGLLGSRSLLVFVK